MTNSGREIILQALVQRLAAINRGDGYNTSPNGVTRGPIMSVGELTTGEIPILFVEDGREGIKNMCSRLGESEWDVWIHGQIEDASETSAGVNALLWDVKRAVHLFTGLDASNWESGQGQLTAVEFQEIDVYRMPRMPTIWGLSARLHIMYQEPLTLTVSPA